jgi:hypothetical protein
VPSKVCPQTKFGGQTFCLGGKLFILGANFLSCANFILGKTLYLAGKLFILGASFLSWVQTSYLGGKLFILGAYRTESEILGGKLFICEANSVGKVLGGTIVPNTY